MNSRFYSIFLSIILAFFLVNGPSFAQEAEKAMSIHTAVSDHDLKMTRLILQADPKAVNARGVDNWTPLMFAARFGRKDMVELVLSFKPDIDAKDRDGYTALHQAAAYGHEDIINLLLDKKASVNLRTEGRVTPRRLAKSNGHFKCARILRDHGGTE
jgi:ankyrin repeat protein